MLCLRFFGCGGGGLGALECDASVQSEGFLMRPVLSLWVEVTPLSFKAHLEYANIAGKRWFCLLSLPSSSLKYCQLTFPPKKKKKGKNHSFCSFLKLYLTGTMIWIYTDEFVDYRVYTEASGNLQFDANLLFFFIILTCFSKNSVLWGGCRCFPRAPL